MNKIFPETNLQVALALAGYDENRVFCHAGWPNPWVVYPIVKGKINRDFLIRSTEKMIQYSKLGFVDYQKMLQYEKEKVAFIKKVSKI